MYCPYCRSTLEGCNGELFCKVVSCYFSKNMSSLFAEKINDLILDYNTEMSDREDGLFFCVNCGERMKKVEEMHEKCPKCSFEVNKSDYYKIIEFNPHKSL